MSRGDGTSSTLPLLAFVKYFLILSLLHDEIIVLEASWADGVQVDKLCRFGDDRAVLVVLGLLELVEMNFLIFDGGDREDVLVQSGAAVIVEEDEVILERPLIVDFAVREADDQEGEVE